LFRGRDQPPTPLRMCTVAVRAEREQLLGERTAGARQLQQAHREAFPVRATVASAALQAQRAWSTAAGQQGNALRRAAA